MGKVYKGRIRGTDWQVWPNRLQGLLGEMIPSISVPKMTFSGIMCRVLNVKFTFFYRQSLLTSVCNSSLLSQLKSVVLFRARLKGLLPQQAPLSDWRLSVFAPRQTCGKRNNIDWNIIYIKELILYSTLTTAISITIARGRRASQIFHFFWLTARKRHFRDKKVLRQNCLNFLNLQ